MCKVFESDYRMFKTALFDESPILISVVLVIWGLLYLLRPSYVVLGLGIVTLLCLVWFYRYPSMNFQLYPDGLPSPCDGVVKEVTLDPVTQRYKVVVFLNIFDQHHQFYPVTGQVLSSVHKPGTFHPAYLLKKSAYNERHVTEIRSKASRSKASRSKDDIVTITQIAGQIARRIVNNAAPGAFVKQGERMGMIKLSSRVDIEFDAETYDVLVAPGTRVYAMKSLIARSR